MRRATIVAAFTFTGRTDGIGSPRGSVRFSDYYDPDGKRGLRFLLVNATTLWCPYCVEETKGLPSMKADYDGRGVRFMTLLVEDLRGGKVAELSPTDRPVDVGLRTRRSMVPERATIGHRRALGRTPARRNRRRDQGVRG